MTPRSTSRAESSFGFSATQQSVRPAGELKRRWLRFIGWAVCALTVALAAKAATIGDDQPGEALSEAQLTPAEERMKADVSFLAADAQEGREPGTRRN